MSESIKFATKRKFKHLIFGSSTNLYYLQLIYYSAILTVSSSVDSLKNRYGTFTVISAKPCSNALGQVGTCMFMWDCIKSEGLHLGTCSDRFLFGSCCHHNATTSGDIDIQRPSSNASTISALAFLNTSDTTSPPMMSLIQSSSGYASSSLGSLLGQKFPTIGAETILPSATVKQPETTTNQPPPSVTVRPTNPPAANQTAIHNRPAAVFISQPLEQANQTQIALINQQHQQQAPAKPQPSSWLTKPASLLANVIFHSFKPLPYFNSNRRPTYRPPFYRPMIATAPHKSSPATIMSAPVSRPMSDTSGSASESNIFNSYSNNSFATQDNSDHHIVNPSGPSMLTDRLRPNTTTEDIPDLMKQQNQSTHYDVSLGPPKAAQSTVMTTTSEPPTVIINDDAFSSVAGSSNNNNTIGFASYPILSNSGFPPNQRPSSSLEYQFTPLSQLDEISGLSNGSSSTTNDNQVRPTELSFAPDTTSMAMTTTPAPAPAPTPTTLPPPPKSGLQEKPNQSNREFACGVRPMYPQTKVVGGKNAAFGAWPWQVSVRKVSFFGIQSTHRCGGAVISNEWIATAGHCVEDLALQSIRIRVGEHDFSSNREPEPFIERAARRKVVHPKYNFYTYENDLALVQLDQPIRFPPHIAPICLPPDDIDLLGRNATVTGWGRLNEGGTLPNVLQEVRVPIVSNDKCKDMFLSAGRPEYIPDIFLCAGYEEGGRDSCQGDSGGPLQVKGDDGKWFLAGIISWGIGCAEQNLPGVCTRISRFKLWIQSTMNSSV